MRRNTEVCDKNTRRGGERSPGMRHRTPESPIRTTPHTGYARVLVPLLRSARTARVVNAILAALLVVTALLAACDR
jgi:hypothetical protein